MYCRYCGSELPEGALYCQSCGQPTEEMTKMQAAPNVVEEKNYYQQQSVQNVQGASEKVSATPGFICSIIGIFFFGLILGIVGLSLSDKALKQGCENVGLARAGKIIGIIDICIYALGIIIVAIAS